MGNCLLGWINRLPAAALTAGAAVAGLEVAQLADEQSGSAATAWQTPAGVVTAAAGAWFMADTGDAAATWRAFLLARTNLTPAALVRWRVGAPQAFLEAAPVLAADLLTAEALPAGWTWARAHTNAEATYWDAAGVMQAVGANAPRLAHDPATGARLGLLVEQGRTNGCRNPRAKWASTPSFPTTTAPQNWATALTGGLAAEWAGQGTVEGMPYADLRVSGTAVGSGSVTVYLELGSSVVVSTGQFWSLSVFAAQQALVAGPGPSGASTRLVELQSDGATVVTTTTLAQAVPAAGVRLALQRMTHTAALSGGATTARLRPALVLDFAAGAHDVTLRLALPQLELGRWCSTPVMPPAGTVAAAARGVESAAIALPAGFTGEAGALFVEQMTAQQAGIAAEKGSIGLDDGSLTSNSLRLRALAAAGNIDLFGVLGGVTVADSADWSAPLGVALRHAFAWAAGDLRAVASNSGVAFTSAGFAPLPTFTRLQITGGDRQAYIRGLRLYAERLTNGQLAALVGTGATLDATAVTFDSGQVAAGVAPGFRQSLVVAPAEVAGQVVRCDLDDPGNPDACLNVPLAYAGPAWQPVRNFGFATADAPELGSDVVTSKGGQESVNLRFWRRALDLALPMVTAAERWACLDPLLRAAAAGGNVLFVPNPDSVDRAREALLGRIHEPASVAYSNSRTRHRSWQGRLTERL